MATRPNSDPSRHAAPVRFGGPIVAIGRGAVQRCADMKQSGWFDAATVLRGCAAALALAGVVQGSAACETCGSCGPLSGPAGSSAPAAAGGAAGGGGAAGTAGAAGSARPAVPNGACMPTGPTSRELGDALALLHSSSRELSALAARRSSVFVVDPAEGIFRLQSLTGGAALDRVVRASTMDLMLADLNLYYVEGRTLWRASQSATDDMPSSVATLASDTVRLAGYDADHLYYVDGPNLVKTEIAGGEPELLVTGADIGDAKFRAGFVYYVNRAAGQVFRVAATGGGPEVLTSDKLAAIAAVDAGGGQLYFADAHVIYKVKVGEPSSRRALAISGLAWAGKEGPIRKLGLEGDRLYFADDASVGWVATAGGACGLIIAGRQAIKGWAVSDGALYFTDPVTTAGNNSIWRVALP
jgi:hypothetical protein